MNEHKFEEGNTVSLTNDGYLEGVKWDWHGSTPLQLDINYIVASVSGTRVRLLGKKDAVGQYPPYDASAFLLVSDKTKETESITGDVSFVSGDVVVLTQEGFKDGKDWHWGGQEPLRLGVTYVVAGSRGGSLQLQGNTDPMGQYCVYNPSAFQVFQPESKPLRSYREEAAEIYATVDQRDAEIEELQTTIFAREAQIERLQRSVNIRDERIKELWEDFEKVSGGVRKATKEIATIMESKRYKAYMKAK